MKIAVIGAGAIGALVAGYLKHKGSDVFLVGRPDSVEAIGKNGLHISGTRGDLLIRIDIFPELNKHIDLAILAVKTQDIEKAVGENRGHLRRAAILTAQNGIQADKILAKYVPKRNIISSIVMFGSTLLKPHKLVHNFEGKWILGCPFAQNGDLLKEISAALNNIFLTSISDNIMGMKWLKLFLNANNCLPAIIGKSMQETFKDLELCKVSMRIWQEGLEVVKRCGIELISLPDFPLENLMKLVNMPLEQSAKIFSGMMTNLSKEALYGSILQSIKRNRPSEVDYINGEFVALAKNNGAHAKLNERLVRLVHQVELSKKFLTPEELLKNA
jgi:2-dehydropantoate 2-reductase